MTEAQFRLFEAKGNVSFYEYDRDRLKDLIQHGGIVVDEEHRLDLEKTLAKLLVARDVVTELQLKEES